MALIQEKQCAYLCLKFCDCMDYSPPGFSFLSFFFKVLGSFLLT